MQAFPTAVLLLLAACVPTVEEVAVAPRAPAVLPPPVITTRNPPVGGVTLPADRTLGASVAAVPTFATLTRAIAVAGLRENLNGAGPLTLFAPTEEAFGRLAPGTTDALLKPDNRVSLTKLLQLHLVPGRLTSADLLARVQAGGGRATLSTLAGETLTLSLTGSVLTLADGGGNLSYVEVADVRQANGVLHAVNGVLIPRIK